MTDHEPEKHDMDLAADFYAALLGGTVSYGPPPPDSMLAWLQAQERPLAPGAIDAEWERRGIVFDPDDVFIYDARHPEQTVIPRWMRDVP